MTGLPANVWVAVPNAPARENPPSVEPLESAPASPQPADIAEAPAEPGGTPVSIAGIAAHAPFRTGAQDLPETSANDVPAGRPPATAPQSAKAWLSPDPAPVSPAGDRQGVTTPAQLRVRLHRPEAEEALPGAVADVVSDPGPSGTALPALLSPAPPASAPDRRAGAAEEPRQPAPLLARPATRPPGAPGQAPSQVKDPGATPVAGKPIAAAPARGGNGFPDEPAFRVRLIPRDAPAPGTDNAPPATSEVRGAPLSGAPQTAACLETFEAETAFAPPMRQPAAHPAADAASRTAGPKLPQAAAVNRVSAPAPDRAASQPEAGRDRPAQPPEGNAVRAATGRPAAEREKREDAAGSDVPAPAARAAEANAGESGLVVTRVAPAAETRSGATLGRESSSPAEPQPAVPRQAEIHGEPVKPPAAARDISLEVNRGEQRVEVRISERGGDVQVAVRTPDARLAGELRQQLPSLETRLEQAGFRTETWQGAAGGPPAHEARHLAAEPSAGADPQPGMQQGNPDGRRQNQPQQHRQKHDPAGTAPERKQFSGIFSSVR